MTITIANLTIDTAVMRQAYASPEQPFMAIECYLDEDMYGTVIVSSNKRTVKSKAKYLQEYDNMAHTWLIVTPKDTITVMPGTDCPGKVTVE